MALLTTMMASTNAYAAKLHSSPRIMMVIPVHHIGYCMLSTCVKHSTRDEGRTDLRYATPSPAICPFCALSRPFFLKTKDEPISTPLPMARQTPTLRKT